MPVACSFISARLRLRVVVFTPGIDVSVVVSLSQIALKPLYLTDVVSENRIFSVCVRERETCVCVCVCVCSTGVPNIHRVI